MAQHRDDAYVPVMDQASIIQGVADHLSDEPKLTALFLAGSYGRGEADEFSDIDFVAVGAAGDHEALIAAWRTAMGRLTPLIMWKRPYPKTPLINVVTKDWVRCDLYLITPDGLSARAKSTVKPLIDPRGLYAGLKDSLPDSQPNRARVEGLITEFLRVIGMTPVVIGRGELVTAVQGANLTRDMLINLMLEEVTKPDKGGAMHLSKLLPADDFAALMTLPAPAPDRQSALAAHTAIADLFFPRAKRLAKDLGIEWPAEFEAQTRAHLKAQLGLEFG